MPDLAPGVLKYDENMGTTSSDASTKAEELGVQGGASSRAKFPTHHNSVALLMEGDTDMSGPRCIGRQLAECLWREHEAGGDYGQAIPVS